MTEERHVLVIANETVAGKSLIDAVKRRSEEGQLRVLNGALVKRLAGTSTMHQKSAGQRLQRGTNRPWPGCVLISAEPTVSCRPG